jgi:hypothetical protein
VKLSVKSLVMAAALLTALFSLRVYLEFNLASLWWGVSRTADFFVCRL